MTRCNGCDRKGHGQLCPWCQEADRISSARLSRLTLRTHVFTPAHTDPNLQARDRENTLEALSMAKEEAAHIAHHISTLKHQLQSTPRDRMAEARRRKTTAETPTREAA